MSIESGTFEYGDGEAKPSQRGHHSKKTTTVCQIIFLNQVANKTADEVTIDEGTRIDELTFDRLDALSALRCGIADCPVLSVIEAADKISVLETQKPGGCTYMRQVLATHNQKLAEQ